MNEQKKFYKNQFTVRDYYTLSTLCTLKLNFSFVLGHTSVNSAIETKDIRLYR